MVFSGADAVSDVLGRGKARGVQLQLRGLGKDQPLGSDRCCSVLLLALSKGAVGGFTDGNDSSIISML